VKWPNCAALSAAILTTLALGGCTSTVTARRSPVEASASAVAGPLAADAARLIPLQGASNVRSFSGLMGRNGAIPANAFVRAADLNRLTAADTDLLAGRGVVLDVDLRTAEEVATAADPLAADSRFRYVRVSLLGSEKLGLDKLPDSLGELYVQSLAANTTQYRQVFEAMAAAQPGPVLFHCTAGKDRTGMISALLLSLAGVSRSDIVHNYSLSAGYLATPEQQGPQVAEMIRQNPKIVALMGSPPEAIESFLDALERQHGGARAYFRSIGVSDVDVAKLQRRLGQSR